MPVTATPVACSSLTTLTPQTTQVFGCDSPARIKAVQGYQGQTLNVDWAFTDPTGRPVDLTTCGAFTTDTPSTGSVKLTMHESALVNDGNPVLSVIGSVTDLAGGLATFALTSDMTLKPGIFLAEAVVYNGSGNLIFLNQFRIIINRSLTGMDSTTQCSGFPSIAEIRLHLRDSDGADNVLLDTVQFDLAEIALAIEYPVIYWNEAPPPICQNYTTSTYPFRYHWLQAIVSRLYITAAHWFRRNHLKFQAQGGVGVDDLNKAQEYDAKADQLWQEYKDWVRMKKVQLNAIAGIQWSGGGYNY